MKETAYDANFTLMVIRYTKDY